MVLALNMMDEMRGNGGTASTRWNPMLGIPVIPISAAKNEGVDELVDHAVHVAKYQERPGRMDFVRMTTAAPCTAACTASCTSSRITPRRRGIPVRFCRHQAGGGRPPH